MIQPWVERGGHIAALPKVASTAMGWGVDLVTSGDGGSPDSLLSPSETTAVTVE